MMAMDLAVMAQRIVDDQAAPIRDREHAMAVLHCVHRNMDIEPHDAERVRVAHGWRQRDALGLGRLYGVVP
jgi:hypothetical protein